MDENHNDDGVGYKRPPKHSQFQPGRSGNPSGRPKKARTIRSDLEEELSALTIVKEGAIAVEVSKQRAIVKALVNAAIEGNQRAVAVLLNLCAKIPDAYADEDDSPEEIEILKAYHQRQNPTNKEEDPSNPVPPKETSS